MRKDLISEGLSIFFWASTKREGGNDGWTDNFNAVLLLHFWHISLNDDWLCYSMNSSTDICRQSLELWLLSASGIWILSHTKASSVRKSEHSLNIPERYTHIWNGQSSIEQRLGAHGFMSAWVPLFSVPFCCFLWNFLWNCLRLAYVCYCQGKLHFPSSWNESFLLPQLEHLIFINKHFWSACCVWKG